MKKHKKDNHSNRGLVQKVENRKKFQKYLKKRNPEEYKALIAKLGLRN